MQLWSPSRLRNGVKNWKEITPGPLQKAIEALRRNFEESTWKISEIMRQGCYPALHRGMGKQARMINDAIKKIGHPAFPSVDEGESEPTVFTAYFDRSTELLAKEIQRTFSHFLDIASAQSALLNSDPVDWASLQTRLLIADESHRTPLWTKNTCDKQPYDPLDDPNEAIHWTKWRAPKWFFMQPFGSRPYDPITAWDRMDEGESRHLLEVIEDRFNQHLVMALEKAVDETHIQLAKRRNQMELRQGPPESGSKQHAPRAPKPPTMLSGTGGWTSPHPKPMQIPPNPPAFFPLDLWPKTCVVLAEAVKKFPNRNQQLAELCRHYISEMTPLFYEAMREARCFRKDLVGCKTCFARCWCTTTTRTLDSAAFQMGRTRFTKKPETPKSGGSWQEQSQMRRHTTATRLLIFEQTEKCQNRPTLRTARTHCSSRPRIVARWSRLISKRFGARQASALPRGIFGVRRAIKPGRNSSDGSGKTPNIRTGRLTKTLLDFCARNHT